MPSQPGRRGGSHAPRPNRAPLAQPARRQRRYKPSRESGARAGRHAPRPCRSLSRQLRSGTRRASRQEGARPRAHNAAAHATMAEIKFAHELDFAAAEREVEEALAVDAKNAGALYVAAGLAVRGGDLASADRSLDRGLAINPNDLRLLSTKAAVRFFVRRPRGLREAEAVCFLQKNPEYARLLSNRRRVCELAASPRRNRRDDEGGRAARPR